MGTGHDEERNEFSQPDLPKYLNTKCISEGTGHTIQSKLHPSDTYPYTCIIMNQHVNDISNKTEDKLE